MEPIIVLPTDHSPRASFQVDGKLLLEGKSLPENVAEFYNPLMKFCEQLELEEVTIDFNLEYFNTATSKKLLDLLQVIDANDKIGKVQVNWHYEEGDDDSMEMAEIYEEVCIQRCKFKYIMHAESISLSERVNFMG